MKNFIRINGLNVGKYENHFEYGDDFLAGIGDFSIKGGGVNADIVLDKSEHAMMVDFNINGRVLTECDRCGDDLWLDIKWHESVPVMIEKEGFNNSTEDIIFVKPDDTELAIDDYIAEFIKLSLPLKIAHEKRGMCNQDVLKLLDGKDNAASNSQWDVLKNLKQNKK